MFISTIEAVKLISRAKIQAIVEKSTTNHRTYMVLKKIPYWNWRCVEIRDDRINEKKNGIANSSEGINARISP